MTSLRLVLALICTSGPAFPQEVMRSVEMPAHRALMSQSKSRELSPFVTDGCSGGLSASWRVIADTFPQFEALYEAQPPWEDCCVIHDRAYHDAGGAMRAEASYDARLSADDALRACVKAHGEMHANEYAERYGMTADQIRSVHSITAEAMFMAVRFGGGPCSGLPWRWGFGYPGCSIFDAPARE